MFHFPFDIPAATDPALFAADGADCPIRRSLALLAAGLDTRFLRVGTALAGAIETIDRMIGGLDGIVGPEVSLHVDHACGQQRRSALDQGATRAVVDDDRARRLHREGDPQLPRRQARVAGPHDGADAGLA